MTVAERLNLIKDDELRKQAKFDHIISVMQGETANFSAGVYVSAIAGFAIACSNIGLDPISTIVQIGKHARDECRKLLAEQGVQTVKRLDG